MNEIRQETIPVDSIQIARRVMTGSRSTLQNVVRTVVEATGLLAFPGSIREELDIATNIISPEEFADKKLSHRRLGAYSVASLERRFNEKIDRRTERLNDYVSNVGLGRVEYEEGIFEGEFVVGFMLSDIFRDRIRQERIEAIDKLLDTARLPLTDPFRQWRNEVDDSLMLTVLRLSTAHPAVDDVLGGFSEELNKKSDELSIDFLNARARMTVVDLHVGPNF